MLPRLKTKRLLPLLAVLSLLLTSAFAPSGSAQTDVPREETLIIAMNSRMEDPTNFNMTSWTGQYRSK